MATFLVRVELPDRPGALGAVASRIGAVRGDVVAVEIVQRRQGAAVDEFVVELADESRLPLLLSEIGEVDGVSVEAVLPVTGRGHDRRIDAYATAAALIESRTPHDVLDTLARRVCAELDATWCALVDVAGGLVVASQGRAPAAPWLAALIAETRASPGDPPPPSPHPGAGTEEAAPAKRTAGGSAPAGQVPTAHRAERPEAADIVWVDLAAWDLVLAAGRPGWRFGARERSHLVALARLADARWIDLAERDGRDSHPGCAG